MSTTPEMDKYNGYGQRYEKALLNKDFRTALQVVLEVDEYLKTLDFTTRMYGDHHGWTTVHDLIHYNNSRANWLRGLLK